MNLPELGKQLTNTGLTLSTPRQWTDQEVNWMLKQKDNGASVSEIAELLDRTPISVQVKLKRLSKTADSYNEKHRHLKYAANDLFYSAIRPKSVLDLFSCNSWYADKDCAVITNDLSEDFETDYSEPAKRLLMQFALQAKRFDLVDLDPYGSAYECFDLAIELARKAIVISFGEYGHLRWKRLDFVRDRYQIHSLDEFMPEKFVAEAQRIGRLHKKELQLLDLVQYGNFLRAYFKIESMKITEQWESNDS